MKERKFLLSLIIISLSFTALLAGYIMVKRGVDPNPKLRTGTILDKFGDTQQPTANSQQPTAEESQPSLIADRKVVSVANSFTKGSVLYYEKNTGKLFEADIRNKTEEAVSNTLLQNFLHSLWSPNKKEVISVFYSQEGNSFKYHNYETGKTTVLDKNVRSTAFSPDGSLIAYYSFDSQANPGDQVGKIFISQPDGTYQKKILNTRIADLELSWPLKDKIALKTSAGEIFLLTEEGKLSKLLEFKTNLNEQWSPSGTKILFSSLGDAVSGEVALSVKDTESKIEILLPVSVQASKCVWSIDNKNIFCAVSKSSSIDDIYQIDTTNNLKKLIAEPNILIKEIFLSTLEDYILFTNAANEKLYAIRISSD